MGKIIESIEVLKQTAKINVNTPFETIEPYINDAIDIYLRPFLNIDFIRHIEENLQDPDVIVLLPYIRRTIGPLCLMLYTHEGSINIGDSGHTVQKSDKFSPASDTKIAQVIDSLAFRGYQALDRLLCYLYDNADKFPKWVPSDRNNYLNTPIEYQDIGNVDIGYSRLTFEKIRPVISMIEFRYIPELFSKNLDKKLRSALYNEKSDQIINDLTVLVRKYIAALSASIFTSEKSREQRTIAGVPEYRPLIRPLYINTDSDNFFAKEAIYLEARIKEFIRDNAVSLNEKPKDTALNFNNQENKIFVDIG